MLVKLHMIAVLFILFFVSARALAQSPAETGKPTSLTPVKVGIPVFGVNFMPFVIARDHGLYREEGLEVDFIVMSSPTAMAATVTGAIEFNAFAGSTVGAAMQGAPIKLVLALSKKPKYWIFSIPEIRSMAELAGRTMAVGTRGGGAHVYTLFILEKLGLLGKVHVVPMAGFSARAVVNSLISGQVQAGYSSDSTYFELKERGFRELLNYADYVDDPSAGVGTSDRMIETKPEIVQAFINGSYRGMLLYKEKRADSIKVMMRYMKMAERLATLTYDLVIHSFGGDGIIDYEPVRNVLQLRKEILNLPAHVPPPGAVLDNRFAIKLHKRIGSGR